MSSSIIDPLSYGITNVHTICIPYISSIEVHNVILSIKNSLAGYNENPASVINNIFLH